MGFSKEYAKLVMEQQILECDLDTPTAGTLQKFNALPTITGRVIEATQVLK